MELFEEICRYLENKDLKSVSILGYPKQIYIGKDISVHIEKKQEKSSDVPQQTALFKSNSLISPVVITGVGEGIQNWGDLIDLAYGT